jgi:hypothetical protein
MHLLGLLEECVREYKKRDLVAGFLVRFEYTLNE